MSISTELTRMAQNVGALTADTTAIFEALRAKGVDVPQGATLHDVPGLVFDITGGGDNTVAIGNGVYRTKMYGTKIWTVESLRVPATGAYAPSGETIYGLLYPYAAFAEINALLPAGWRIPTKSDYEDLINEVGSTVGSRYISDSFGGGNESGFNLPLTGYINMQGSLLGYGEGGYLWTTTPYTTEGSLCNVRCKNTTNTIDVDDSADMNGVKIQIRVCRDVTSTSTVIGGKTYRTVRMPDGNEWLAENLDYKFCPVGGSGIPTTPNAWYYDNNETTYGWNGYKCGLLYNWYAVKLLNDNRSDLCPGWHVPTKTEWDTLNAAIGSAAGTKLKSLDNSITSNWPSGYNGTDDYGFKALPNGCFVASNDGYFSYVNTIAFFWSSTPGSITNAAYFYSLNASSDSIGNNQNLYPYGLALRLVKDST